MKKNTFVKRGGPQTINILQWCWNLFSFSLFKYYFSHGIHVDYIYSAVNILQPCI